MLDNLTNRSIGLPGVRAVSALNRLGPVARRLAGGVGANALGKLWVLLIQALSVPVLSAYWGAEGYGTWLMLITIPTYISLSDFGFGTAAGVELTRYSANRDDAGAAQIFQSAWTFVTAVSLAIGAAAFGCGALVFGQLGPAIGLVVVYALLLVQTQLLLMVFRATRKYAKGVVLVDFLTLLEGLLQLGAVVLGADIVGSLLVLVGCRIIAMATALIVLRRDEPWLRLGWRHASLGSIRELANPSGGAVALSVANSFIIQGVLLALGATAGVATVAAFATGRLIARIPLQISGMVTRASIPELTRALHEGRMTTANRLVRVNIGTALITGVPMAVALLAFGPALAALLSGGKLLPGHDVFVPLVLGALVNTVWVSLATPLVAINRHATFSYLYLGLSLVALLVPFAAPQAEAVAAAWAMLAAEAAVALFVLWRVRRDMAALAIGQAASSNSVRTSKSP